MGWKLTGIRIGIHATRTDAYWQQAGGKLLADAWKDQGSGVSSMHGVRSPFGSAINTYASLAPETKEHSWPISAAGIICPSPCIAGEQHNLENGDIHRMLEWFDLLLKQKNSRKSGCAPM